MAARVTGAGRSFGDSSSPLVSRCRNSSLEEDDDDVVFIESIHPPSTSAPAIADPRNFVVASSRNEKLQGNSSAVLPSSRDSASQKGNISETIVIDDEEDMETNGGEGKHFSSFIAWGLPETKNRTKDVDFSTSGLSRSKTKTGVGPFNPGRMNVAGDEFQNGESATHHNPDSWISQSASFPRNQKQPGVDSLSPVASLPKQISQPSAQQQPTKPVKVTCANCKQPLRKGQTAYQRKGSAHLFCSTSCLSSFPPKPAPKKRSAVCKKDAPTKKAPVFPPLGSRDSFRKLRSASCVSPDGDSRDLRKRVLNKSRCTICGKLTEARHEVSVNNVTHRLCSNDCFDRYRTANGLTMNCCEQCGEYLPSKGAARRGLAVDGQQKRFCGQSCVSAYTQCRASVQRRDTTSPAGSAKIRRKAIDLETKVKIVNAREAGKKVKEIARDLQLAHSTVSTILKDKDRVREAAGASGGFQTVITRRRKGLIHEAEKRLATWLDEQARERGRRAPWQARPGPAAPSER